MPPFATCHFLGTIIEVTSLLPFALEKFVVLKMFPKVTPPFGPSFIPNPSFNH